ncbi:DNA mismatch repair endonuclease MutL [Gemmatimonadota bacterium]
MSARIHILAEQVVNRIAAGEVVERPASVVKELVENALDAGAESVRVVLQTGGRDRIEVSDDGVGMDPSDAKMALERHATSKITSDEDLQALQTFGFRGEALPSIASVSRLTLETSDGTGPEGIRLVLEGGRLTAEEPVARQRGTKVVVEHLFANVPARRKFLRATQTEYRHALNAVTEAALSRLGVSFRLEHDGREIFRLPGGQGMAERARELFGTRNTKDAVTLAAETEAMRLTGVLGAPAAARRTASAVHIFVNGRPVSHRGLSYALYSGYGELLPDGSYPFACLFLQVPAGQVDVNVHPAKREVRFNDESSVKDFVIMSVREALSRELGAPPLSLDRLAGRGGRGATSSGRGTHPPIRPEDLPWRDLGLFGEGGPEARRTAEALFDTAAPEGAVSGAVHEGAGELDPATGGLEPVIWQIHDRFLLAPTRGGLLIVDQHAAHERVLYEKALAQLQGEPAARQQLLFPRIMDLSAEQYALVEELGPLLSRVGFDVRPFGGNTITLDSVPPAVERAGREEEVFVALLDDLSERGARGSGVQEKIAASLACHAAIRFGDRLDTNQRRGLVDQLFACERPQVCPHGRPTHLVLSLEELERRFGR